MAMYKCRNTETVDEIATQIEITDSLIGEMVSAASEHEIHWSVLVSRILTHGIVGLHHLLIEQNENITADGIHEEVMNSTNIIHQLYVAQNEMDTPRIIH